MKNPKEYKKPIAVSMGFLNACYLAFALVIYRYCGSEFWASPCCSLCNNMSLVAWISSPALGSAGPLIKKLTYGIALPGLIMSSTVNQHVSRTWISILHTDNHWQGNYSLRPNTYLYDYFETPNTFNQRLWYTGSLGSVFLCSVGLLHLLLAKLSPSLGL